MLLKKNEWNSFLIFCDIYFKIIKQIRDEVFSFMDEFEKDYFIFSNDFTIFRLIKDNSVIDYDDNDEDDDSLTNFKFKTDDNLVYNKKINVPICIISICSVIKKDWIYYPIFKLQKSFHENENFKKIITFFVYKHKRWITLLIIKKTRDIILKRAKDYYYNNMESIRQNMRDKYKNLSEEEREKMRKYQKNYREKMKNNISEENREKMREYQKNYGEKKDLIEVFNY